MGKDPLELERLPDDIVVRPVQVKNGEVAIWDDHGLGVELEVKHS